MSGKTFRMVIESVRLAHQHPTGKSMWVKPCGCSIAFSNKDLIEAGTEAHTLLLDVVQQHKCPHDAMRQIEVTGDPKDPSGNRS